MRQDRIIQASIFDLFSEHEIGRELKAMSAWLDAHREVIALVAAELCRPGLKPTGRDGLPAESVLRCALLKQYRQLSYQELAFHLSDLRVVSRLCSAAVALVPEEVGPARDDQRDQRPGPGSGSIAVYWPAPARPRSRPARCCAWIAP